MSEIICISPVDGREVARRQHRERSAEIDAALADGAGRAARMAQVPSIAERTERGAALSSMRCRR